MNQPVFKEDFLGTRIDEVEEIVRVGMAKHPRVSQQNGTVFFEKNAGGRDTAMRLADVLQIK